MRSISLIGDHMRMPDFSRKIQDQRVRRLITFSLAQFAVVSFYFNKITSLRQVSFFLKKNVFL